MTTRELQPCGTMGAYRRHRKRGEDCDQCSEAARVIWQAKNLAKSSARQCSGCGKTVARSPSSADVVTCHPCRRKRPVCGRPGCSEQVRGKRARFCSRECAYLFRWGGRPKQPKRPTTSRGYGAERQEARLAAVAAYRPGDECSICLGPMTEDPAFLDLHHDPAGGGYAGLAHASCNRAEGAARGNASRLDDRPPFPAGWLAAHAAA